MLKLMMGHSQSSRMGKTYYNVGAGSIGSVVGERASALNYAGRVFPLCSGARWVLTRSLHCVLSERIVRYAQIIAGVIGERKSNSKREIPWRFPRR